MAFISGNLNIVINNIIINVANVVINDINNVNIDVVVTKFTNFIEDGRVMFENVFYF